MNFPIAALVGDFTGINFTFLGLVVVFLVMNLSILVLVGDFTGIFYP